MQSRAWNVLHAFHQADELIPIFGAARGEAYAAIAHNRSRNAVIDTGLKGVIPTDLAIIMGVKINEAGRDDVAYGI